MMGTSGGIDHMSCSEVALLLEKKVSEELLSNDERHILTHHLDSCDTCRDFERLASSLPAFADQLSNDELAVAVRTAVDTVFGSGDPRERNVRRWIYIAASVAAAVLMGVLAWSRLSPEPSPAPVASTVFKCTPAEPAQLVRGVFMTYCDAREPGAVIENGGEVQISLRSGTVGLFIDPNRPNKRRVTVVTPRGEVRVKGTVFSVHVDEDDAWVEVFRGIVEVVENESEAVALEIPAGNGAALGTRTTYRLSRPKTGMLQRELSLKATENTVAARGGENGSEEAPSEVAAVPDDAGEGADGESGGATRGTDGALRRSVASMDVLIQDAQSCLIARDWKCAVAHYQKVLKRYSARPESIAVLISLAKIELRHLGAPKSALGHYKSYQLRAPNGPLAEEAQYGVASAYRNLGAETEEAKALKTFVERFPHSSLTGKARARLRQLNVSVPL